MGYYSNYGGIDAKQTFDKFGLKFGFGHIGFAVGVLFMLGVLIAVAFEKNVPTSLVVLSWVGISITVLGYLYIRWATGSCNPFKVT